MSKNVDSINNNLNSLPVRLKTRFEMNSKKITKPIRDFQLSLRGNT